MIKIGLFMTMNQVMVKYSGIMKLVDELVNDKDVEFKYLHTNNVPDSVKDFLNLQPDCLKQQYNPSLVTNNSNDFDYVITIDPYYGPHCKGSGYNKWTTKIIYKEYGVTGIDGSQYLYNTGIYKKAWRIITDTNDTRNSIINVTKRPAESIIIGNPAFDNTGTNKLSEHKCIIWSPHCSILSKGGASKVVGGRFSTFMEYKNFFENEIPNMFPNVEFIYKLHPALGDRIKDGIKSGEIDSSFNYEEWKKSAESNPNVEIIENSGNYYDLFNKSSLMISDSISFMAEYLSNTKPIIVLRDKTSSKFSPYAEKLIDNCYYNVNDSVELIDIINDLIFNNLSDIELIKLQNRLSFLKEYKPYKSTNSEYIINYIKSFMQGDMTYGN